MGSNICHVLEEDSAIWYLPQWPPRNERMERSVPYAERPFEQGEIIEKAYCLDFDLDALNGIFLKEYCFEATSSPGESERLLLPFGWGLLYGRRPGHANLKAEHSFEPPPTPSGGSPCEDGLTMCHFIFFRALRDIDVGEELIVQAPVTSAGTIFEAAYQNLVQRDSHPMELMEDDDNDDDDDDNDDDDEQLESLLLSAKRPLMVGASPVHNVGVFATRDIEENEVLEIAPCVPLPIGTVAGTTLEHYVFAGTSPINSSQKVHLLSLGLGSIYNHSKKKDVSYWRTGCPSCLYLKWIAERDIEMGSEVFSNYGDAYFATRRLCEVTAD